ncbi:MAG: hypothetical protein EXR53_06275 [Dehalococcoidia bacterium]|nr:hypothetical protein [Dehalococcoidia bacterium]
MEIHGIIDKLETLASEGKKLPMGKKALIDPDKLLELVDQLRVAVPQDIVESQGILKKREELLNQSLGEARRIRSSAETEFRSRLDDHEMLKEAKSRADKIVEEAQQKAQRILDMVDTDASNRRGEADRYAQETLYKLEQQVANTLSTVRNGIEVIESHLRATVG